MNVAGCLNCAGYGVTQFRFETDESLVPTPAPSASPLAAPTLHPSNAPIADKTAEPTNLREVCDHVKYSLGPDLSGHDANNLLS